MLGSTEPAEWTAAGERMSAPMWFAACAICSEKDGPGNASRRSPASQGVVVLSTVVAVSLRFTLVRMESNVMLSDVLIYQRRSNHVGVQVLRSLGQFLIRRNVIMESNLHRDQGSPVETLILRSKYEYVSKSMKP